MNNYDDNIHNVLEEQKNKAINFMIIGMTFLGVIGVPFSVSRFLYTGWQVSYSMHCVGLLVIIFLLFFRHKLPQGLKLYTVTIFALLISVLGLIIYGLYGNGILWGVVTLLLLFFFFDTQKILVGSGIILIVYLGSMYQFVFAKKTFPGDANIFLSQFTAWATAFFGSAMFVILIASIVRSQKNQTKEFLLLLEDKNQKIEHMANHDALTDLPSLRLATEQLELVINLAERNGKKVALMFLDLDGFKLINDTYGHDAGDEVLIKVSNRISTIIRKSDTACRIGGDEFLIILSDLNTISEVKEVAERLVNKIREKIAIKDFHVEVGVSIGISIYPDNATNSADLRKKADELMYSVKKTGKNNFAISS